MAKYFYSYFKGVIYSINNIVTNFMQVKKLISNWYEIILFECGLKSSIEVHLKYTNRVYKINSIRTYNRFWYELPSYNKKIAKTYLQRLGSEYDFLTVKNNNVIDIGASFGDTAIHFAFAGAKKIWAIEPYPYTFNIAKRNIKSNGLEKKIILIRAAAGKPKNVHVLKRYITSGGSDLSHISDNGIKTRVYSLKELINKFKIPKNSLLKVDCEGCEYSLLLCADNQTLRRFKLIQLEYHYGYLDLVNKLKQAHFKVTYTWPRFSLNNDASNKKTFVGYIYAQRI
ncbi:MAG: FkbM family methyltransferase [Candidatus Micrarchaeaceae archaeon]